MGNNEKIQELYKIKSLLNEASKKYNELDLNSNKFISNQIIPAINEINKEIKSLKNKNREEYENRSESSWFYEE